MEKYASPGTESTSVGNISIERFLSCTSKGDLRTYKQFWNEVKFLDFGYIHKTMWLFNGTLQARNKFLLITGTSFVM